ncbi:propionyl-CoA synthetase [Halomonas daqingensis]|uniref:Propionyl-CoA synthetase n=1 Tax=Billgrantia desiderata TaxID=52021 RepID=A0ABS9AZY8_9GAMM|nr:propionyl-CoA synthetase [Halomonas desiderata]MCE8027279.1 propionyl-CoA synthetase [Halomonas desiderata]MCE8040946.1 propionyl-CoA synthetase [Halomonas desiderata]MCE8045521.1 propionyl-CoA synthetase [Halomonas desiderata]NIC37723.1 propionyl-CoA synthetase [Halomonas desiderata]
MPAYKNEFQRSIEQPQSFWADQARRIPWFTPPKTILEYDEQGHARWYTDGELNLCHAALDHHVDQGRGDQPAIYWDSPVTGGKRTLTYREMRDEVALFAGALKGLGVEKGDRVVIYMPMVPEALVAMYACARLGAVHSVVFGGFAPHELAVRIDDAKPKVVVAASCGVEIDRVIAYQPNIAAAIELSEHKPDACIYLQRQQQLAELGPRDLDWSELLESAEPADCVPVKGSDPLYVLYTSGTTGKPKGVVRDTAGYAVALHYSMETIYDVAPGDVFFSASDVGWVVGHSYIVYAPLLRGCTTVVYEGKPVKTPDAGAFWRLISQYRVKSFFTAPTAFRAIKKEDPDGILLQQYDISCLKALYLAGERLDPPTFHWLDDLLDVPVIDHWWQTETGWPIAANLQGLEPMPTKAGSATVPVPGFNVQILNREGEQAAPMEQGSVVIKQPMPPGCLIGVWGDPQRFHSAYMAAFPGYYLTGDGGYFDEEGYLFIMGRTDDVINVAGHRLSTGEMEEVVGAHRAVAECAVIGIHDALKGQIPVGLVIPKDGFDGDEVALENELIALVREKIGPIACFKQVLVVNRLPKTRSGKILRKLLRNIADGKEYGVPSTIDDPASLQDVHEAMKARDVGSAHEARQV